MIDKGDSPDYKVKIDRGVRASMPDGVQLAAVLVRPDAEGKFPAIMSYNPYRWLTQIKDSSSETEYNHRWHGPSYFAERGYAVIYFDVRGTGNSGGSSQDIYSDQERKDAYDMVEWIAAQPWCDGNVGMWGMSYGGVVQWQVGVQNPPHLKTLVVGSSNDDVYLDWTYPGGSLRPYMFDTFSPFMTANNFAPPDVEIVGEAWNDLWKERLEKSVPWGIGFISHQEHGRYWRDRSLQPDYSRIKVPVMLWSGWADCYPTPILRAFSNLRVPKKVIVGPWGHYWPEEALPGPQIDGRWELLKWFDQWLKGINTGVLNEPTVTLFIRQYKDPAPRMCIEDAGFWRGENEWPLARTQYTDMYLHAEAKLCSETLASSPQEHDQFVYNPTVGVTAGIYWGGGILPWGMPVDQRLDEAYSLVYTTSPLEEDLEVTGDPKAVLYVSSTADTAYFHVKLSDVGPDGTSKWVTDGGLLASHRNSHAEPEALTPGEIFELTIDLKYLAYVFAAGHRIRVDIASADFQNAWPTAKPAVNTIYRGGNYPSRIILPIVPCETLHAPSPKLKSSPRPRPTAEQIPGADHKVTAEHKITYDMVNQSVTASLARNTTVKSHDDRTVSYRRGWSSYTISQTNPADTVLKANHEYTMVRPEGEIKVEANEVLASDDQVFHYQTHVQIAVDSKLHFQKRWNTSVLRKFN